MALRSRGELAGAVGEVREADERMSRLLRSQKIKDDYFTLVMTYPLSAWTNSKSTILPTVSLSNTILSLT